MAQLSKVVGSILRDMVLAQHEANRYALSLSESYRGNGRAADFPVPAVGLGEMELVLRYGVSGELVQNETSELDYALLRTTVGMLSSQLAQVVVSSIVSSVMTGPQPGAPAQENLIVRLDREQSLYRDFTAYLGRRFAEALQSDLPRLVDLNGSVDAAVVSECILHVSEGVVLDHDDLGDLFAGKGAALRTEAREHLRTAVGGILPRLLADVHLMRTVKTPSLDVIVSSKELAKLPQESIHTFRFKISPRELPLSTNEVSQ